MAELRPSIDRAGKSEADRRLTHRYANLLALHDRYRASVTAATRLPGVMLALCIVSARIDVLHAERKAA